MSDIYLVDTDLVKPKFQAGVGRYYDAEEIESCERVKGDSIDDVAIDILCETTTEDCVCDREELVNKFLFYLVDEYNDLKKQATIDLLRVVNRLNEAWNKVHDLQVSRGYTNPIEINGFLKLLKDLLKAKNDMNWMEDILKHFQGGHK